MAMLTGCALQSAQRLRVAVPSSGSAPSKRKRRCCAASAAGFMTRSTNPAVQYGKVREAIQNEPARGPAQMTVDGAVGKTAILLLITAAGAVCAWQQCAAGLAATVQAGVAVPALQSVRQTAMISGISGFVLAMATIFKPNWARITAPLYAACKGFALGATSYMFEYSYPGIVVSAVLLTMSTAAGLLGLHRTRMISVSDRMRSVITTALTGVMCSYLALAGLRMFGVHFGFLSGGPVAIGVSLLTTVVAAAVLLLDFDGLERMQFAGAPRWYEWYGGFTILMTLVWLYVEMLRLLSLFRGSEE